MSEFRKFWKQFFLGEECLKNSFRLREKRIINEFRWNYQVNYLSLPDYFSIFKEPFSFNLLQEIQLERFLESLGLKSIQSQSNIKMSSKNFQAKIKAFDELIMKVFSERD